MALFDKPEALVFDVDGTLFQTESILDNAYYQTFQDLKELYHDEPPSIEKMYACIGMTEEELWANIAPNASNKIKKAVGKRMIEWEIDGLKNGLGKLYPKTCETLEYLKNKGYSLFVASNGEEDYVKGVIKYTGLEHLFEEVYSAGEYKTVSKVDLVKLILNNHNVTEAWMIGDRSSDVEAGIANGLTVVGCDYAAFKKRDELVHADLVIRSLQELLFYL